MSVVASRGNTKRAYFYACDSFHRRGHTVCSNNRQAVMEDTDRQTMEALQEELLDPVVIEYG